MECGCLKTRQSDKIAGEHLTEYSQMVANKLDIFERYFLEGGEKFNTG